MSCLFLWKPLASDPRTSDSDAQLAAVGTAEGGRCCPAMILDRSLRLERTLSLPTLAGRPSSCCSKCCADRCLSLFITLQSELFEYLTTGKAIGILFDKVQ